MVCGLIIIMIIIWSASLQMIRDSVTSLSALLASVLKLVLSYYYTTSNLGTPGCPVSCHGMPVVFHSEQLEIDLGTILAAFFWSPT